VRRPCAPVPGTSLNALLLPQPIGSFVNEGEKKTAGTVQQSAAYFGFVLSSCAIPSQSFSDSLTSLSDLVRRRAFSRRMSSNCFVVNRMLLGPRPTMHHSRP
jgi:hypothetical protein